MDDPTMRGYQGWLDEEHKRERKEPGFIVDDGKLVENPELDKTECLRCDEMIYPNEGYCEECLEEESEEKRKEMMDMTVTIDADNKKFLTAHKKSMDLAEKIENAEKLLHKEELSDPTDCPRCRGVKENYENVCDQCFREGGGKLSNKEMNEVVRSKHTGEWIICYPMSFMAEKKLADITIRKFNGVYEDTYTCAVALYTGLVNDNEPNSNARKAVARSLAKSIEEAVLAKNFNKLDVDKKEEPPHGKCPGCSLSEYLFNGFCFKCHERCEKK